MPCQQMNRHRAGHAVKREHVGTTHVPVRRNQNHLAGARPNLLDGWRSIRIAGRNNRWSNRPVLWAFASERHQYPGPLAEIAPLIRPAGPFTVNASPLQMPPGASRLSLRAARRHCRCRRMYRRCDGEGTAERGSGRAPSPVSSVEGGGSSSRCMVICATALSRRRRLPPSRLRTAPQLVSGRLWATCAATTALRCREGLVALSGDQDSDVPVRLELLGA
jgi:hypothetical protein